MKMSQDKVRSQLFALLREVIPKRFSTVEPKLEQHLRRDLGIDSLGLTSLAFRCEETLGIKVEQYAAEITDLRTVQDLADLLDRALEAS